MMMMKNRIGLKNNNRCDINNSYNHINCNAILNIVVFISIFSSILILSSHFSYSLSDDLTISVICGNNECEIGENSDNCPTDCAILPFEYSINSNTNIILEKEESRIVNLEIKNKLNKTIEIELSIDEKLKDIVTLNNDNKNNNFDSSNSMKYVILPRKSNTFPILFHLGDNLSNNSYNGFVSILYNNIDEKIFFEIKEKKKGLEPNRMFVQIVDDEITPFDNLVVDYTFFSENIESKVLIFNLSVYDVKNNIFIHNFEKEIDYNDYLYKGTEDISISSLPIELDGDYQFIITTYIDGKYIESHDDFKVYKIFWTPIKIFSISLIIICVFLSIALYYIYKSYKKYKLEKMRYIPPDFKKLPKNNEKAFWIGKVAETNKLAYYDPNDLTTHILVAGSTGSGKSVCASVFVEEALNNNIAVVVFDPTSQWTGFVKQCTDKNLLKYYKEFNMREDEAKSFKGLIYNIKTPNVKLDLKKYLNPGEVTVFNMEALKTGQYDIAVQDIINMVFDMKHEESPELKMLFVFDEVHRLLEKYGGSGGYKALEKGCREFRKWGIGIIMVSQVSADFKEAVAGNILTEVQLNTKSMEDIGKIAQKSGYEYSTKVTRQGIGVGMIQNPKYNNGKPWFVHFRPTLHNPHNLPENELELYTSYSKRIDTLEIMLLRVKSTGENVEELLTELKLAKNKLKEGKFKMVDMYLRTISENTAKKASPEVKRIF